MNTIVLITLILSIATNPNTSYHIETTQRLFKAILPYLIWETIIGLWVLDAFFEIFEKSFNFCWYVCKRVLR